MYIVWNVQEAENVGILASLKISHFPFWFPTLKGSIREREGNGKNPFPKFGNGKGMKKIHSRNSGTGREWKKAIPEIREWEGNEKKPFPKFGKGIRGLHSWEWPGTGIPAHPCHQPHRLLLRLCQFNSFQRKSHVDWDSVLYLHCMLKASSPDWISILDDHWPLARLNH